MNENNDNIVDAEVVENEDKTTSLAPVSDSLLPITADELEVALQQETEKRRLIDKYIKDNMVYGVDYAEIPGCGNKPTLLKPGAERVLSLFNLRAEFCFDVPTHECMPQAVKDSGVVCLKCMLHNRNDIVVSEGYGVAEHKERKNWTRNMQMKIAKKRALVDACLSVASLSDRFTQDLEDMPRDDKPDIQTPNKPRVSGNSNKDDIKTPADGIRDIQGEDETKRKRAIRILMAIKDVAAPDEFREIGNELQKEYGTRYIKDMPASAMDTVIERLKHTAEAYGVEL